MDCQESERDRTLSAWICVEHKYCFLASHEKRYALKCCVILTGMHQSELLSRDRPKT